MKSELEMPTRKELEKLADNLSGTIEWHSKFPDFGNVLLPKGERLPVSRRDTIKMKLVRLGAEKASELNGGKTKTRRKDQ